MLTKLETVSNLGLGLIGLEKVRRSLWAIGKQVRFPCTLIEQGQGAVGERSLSLQNRPA